MSLPLDRPRSSGSRIRSAVIVLLALCALALGPGVAAADAPFRVPNQITDRSSALGGNTASVKNAIDTLYSQDKVQLWVVYVNSFDGQAGNVWANASGALSGFDSHTMLLAVATVDKSYGYYVPSGFPLSKSQVDTIAANDIVPQLKAANWSGAAVAAADGLRSTIGGSSGSGSKSWILWVILIVILAGGLIWYLRARKSRAADPNRQGSGHGSGSGGDAPAGPVPVPLEPLQSVSDRSVQLLIASDNAVHSSEQQLIIAESTFGAAAMDEFRAAFESARTSLAAAFQLRQQIDDDIPEDESTRRAWMEEIIQRCTDADNALDAQSDRFDAMLDLKNRLPAAVADIEAALQVQEARVAEATGTLAQLGSAYAPSALSAVITNASEASNRLDFAKSSIATARGEESDADTTPAVVAARNAQESVAQATTLLDAIDRLSSDLADAKTRLPGRLAPVQAELAAARAAFGQGSTGSAGPTISARLTQVETSLAAVAGPNGTKDPILATQRVREADATLDEILAATRSAQDVQQRALAALQQSLDSAQARITGANDFINTRRGAVGSEARTRLAEAQRHLENAVNLSNSDPAGALAESRQAESLADEASRLAQNDIGRWQGPGGGGYAGGGFGRGGGGNFTGAILGGLLGGMLSGGGGFGGFGGGGGGGFGGGGSFGGGGGGGGGGGFSGGGRF
jgi:hypothetical protein